MPAEPSTRTTLHSGKSGDANHNEHDFFDENFRDVAGFDFTLAYSGGKPQPLTPDDASKATLKDRELAFYMRRYGAALTKQNAKYQKRRQYKRMRTIEDVYSHKNTKPTETILQYGNEATEKKPDKETFCAMVKDYIHCLLKWSREHGYHLIILDFSCHFDETSPHAHIRTIWDYEDEDGTICIGQEKGMAQAGLELPDPTKPVGRKNNRLMTWTALCRTTWQDIVKEYGFEVEREPLPTKKAHEKVPDMERRLKQEIVDKTAAIAAREAAVAEREAAITSYDDQIAEKQGQLADLDKSLLEASERLSEAQRALKAAQTDESALEAVQSRIEALQGDISVSVQQMDASRIADYFGRYGERYRASRGGKVVTAADEVEKIKAETRSFIAKIKQEEADRKQQEAVDEAFKERQDGQTAVTTMQTTEKTL